MSTLGRLTSIWENVKEIELKPIAAEALQEINIAIVGRAGSGRHTLAGQMRIDPQRPSIVVQSPLLISDLDNAASANRAQVIILMLDINQDDDQAELALARGWVDSNKKIVIFFNKLDQLGSRPLPGQESRWAGLPVFHGSAANSQFLQHAFVPLVLRLLPDKHLALGRQFPLFRQAIARSMIQDASLSNAAYAFSTGLAETVPVLDIPLNMADIFILTKAQAFLVYRLGLLLGFTTRWQDYVSEFGSVIGTGFLWRQIARQLVGLIPVWGIAPKIAISYSGTYVVGHAVLQWYLTGRHIGRAQINALYRQAFKGGKVTAARLMSRIPRVHLLKRPPKALPPPVKIITCVHCGKLNSADANFCQYCGQNL